MIKTLLALRLIYYKSGILERLKRFKLLVFFILATLIPSTAIMAQFIQLGSVALINGSANISYFLDVTILQLITMIWVGSQYDCLKIRDVENYFRTLKISDKNFFVVELIFSTVILAPFIIFLLLGLYFTILKAMSVLAIAHVVYLFSSLLFISLALVFSRVSLVVLLIVFNGIFVYFPNGSVALALSAALYLASYFFIIQRRQLPFKFNTMVTLSQLPILKHCPNIALNLKSLLSWSTVYTTCIFGFNLLTLFVFVSYVLANHNAHSVHSAFLLALLPMMFLCSLLMYKLSETRHEYGTYFSLFYSKAQLFLFDVISLYVFALLNWLVIFLTGLSLCVDVMVMLKSLLIAGLCLPLFAFINHRYRSYGPVISLLILAGISYATWGML